MAGTEVGVDATVVGVGVLGSGAAGLPVCRPPALPEFDAGSLMRNGFDGVPPDEVVLGALTGAVVGVAVGTGVAVGGSGVAVGTGVAVDVAVGATVGGIPRVGGATGSVGVGDPPCGVGTAGGGFRGGDVPTAGAVDEGVGTGPFGATTDVAVGAAVATFVGVATGGFAGTAVGAFVGVAVGGFVGTAVGGFAGATAAGDDCEAGDAAGGGAASIEKRPPQYAANIPKTMAKRIASPLRPRTLCIRSPPLSIRSLRLPCDCLEDS